jgi:hypothetical protein
MTLREEGWRGPLLPAGYKSLVSLILANPEWEGRSPRHVVQAALLEFATQAEIEEAGLLKDADRLKKTFADESW